ncbi:peptidase S49 [Flammeovirgaceae bacterium 311]|nr:peptidase S49 [Flammeovirgaceae bacterium 311]
MHEILSTRLWALESKYFDAMAPLVLKRIANGGNIEALKAEHKELQAGLAYDDATGLIVFETEQGKVCIIQVTGAMSKNGGMCSYGTKSLSSAIAKVNSADHIKGIVLVGDTPGGAVDGLPEFAEAIRTSTKPIVTFIDGMLCSAGYWFGSQSRYIIANKLNYATIGSIGTLCMLVDQTEWLKKEGLKVTILRADQSKDKAVLNPYEEAPTEAVEALKAELNLITEDFISAVKAGRGIKLRTGKEDIFTGKTYSKDEALKMGMIDSIGSLNDAVTKVLQLAKQKSTSTIPATTSKQSNMKIFGISFGKEAGAELTDEQTSALQAAEAKANAAEAKVAQQATELESLKSAKAALEQKDQEQAKTISEQADQIKRLEAAGDSTTAAIKEGDNNTGAGQQTRKKYSWEVKAEKKAGK